MARPRSRSPAAQIQAFGAVFRSPAQGRPPLPVRPVVLTRFNAVVLLSAPVDVLLQRIALRTTNDFGKRPAEQDKILLDVRSTEPLLRRRATLEVDTRQPLDGVVEAVLAAAHSRGRSDTRRGSVPKVGRHGAQGGSDDR